MGGSEGAWCALAGQQGRRCLSLRLGMMGGADQGV